MIAAWVGACLLAGGMAIWVPALAGSGALVVASGMVARVTAVAATDTALEIRYAAKRSWSAAWNDVVGLTPPRWALGGWRIHARSGARTVMPSDILGNEAVLDRAIRLAGLRFDGRAWVVPDGPQPS